MLYWCYGLCCDCAGSTVCAVIVLCYGLCCDCAGSTDCAVIVLVLLIVL